MHIPQKLKLSVKDFFSKCEQIRRKLWICLHLLDKSLNFLCSGTVVLTHALRKKCPYSELFWPAFSRIFPHFPAFGPE